MNQLIVAGVARLQIIGFSSVLIPLYQEAGAVLYDHPLQVGRDGGSSSPCGDQRWKKLDILLKALFF